MINNERLLKTFLDYIQIDSQSGEERAMCDRIIADLKKIDINVTEIGTTEELHSEGRNLMILLEGDSDAEPLIFDAHLDTVSPGNGIEPVICDDGYIRSKGDTILGADDKSGVAALIEVLRCIKENNIKHRTIQVLFTIGEESGLYGSSAIKKSDLKSDKIIVLDTGVDVGKIVTSAPGQLHLDVKVFGKASHAGNAPENGISAIRVAAKALNDMKLQRIDEETTANIGVFDAVGATNIVSPEARLLFEIRSRNTKKLYAQANHMIDCFKNACDKMGGKFEYNLTESYLGYSFPDSNELVQLIFNACDKIGIKAVTEATGGGSDANILNRLGVTAVNISTGMENAHTLDEQIKIKNLEDIAKLVLELVRI